MGICPFFDMLLSTVTLLTVFFLAPLVGQRLASLAA